MKTYSSPFKSFSRGLATLVGLIVLLPNAYSEVRFYRYSLTTPTVDSRYVREIANSATNVGTVYSVETDSAHRITRVVTLIDGIKGSEARYQFAPNRPFPNGMELLRGDEILYRAAIERDANDRRKRLEQHSTTGTMTRYLVYTHGAGRYDAEMFTPSGKSLNRQTYFFSTDGELIKTISHSDDAVEITNELDPNTGLAKSRVQTEKGEVTVRTRFTYDASGSLLRTDRYSKDDKWYGMTEYKGGLSVKDLYKFLDGTVQESRTEYDRKRLATETRFLVNDKLICTFVFDRLPTGAVKRTLAKGPDGTLYAEYLDAMVTEVHADGSPLKSSIEKTIHRKGNWW
jgi:hypothetical protein